MFKNHLKIAFRQLAKNKIFASLNILGLALGMTLAILIATFISDEFNHDRWMEDSAETYRVYRIGKRGETAWTPTLLARKLVTDYPEVVNAAAWSPLGEYLVTYDDKDWYIDETAIVDSTFFKVVKMDFLQGDAENALVQPNSIVLTDKLAQQIFGSDNPIGETVRLGGTYDYAVSGVLDTEGKKSHIISDFFIRYGGYGSGWAGNNRSTYVQLKPNADPTRLAQKVETDVNELIKQEYIADGLTPNENDFYRWALQPFNQVYLHSEGWTALGESGSIRNLYIFGCIALLVIIVGIINYVNLTTARASQRSKEVGVKKVTGATTRSLATQFLTESVLQAFVAGTIAILLAEICLPYFNGIMNRELLVLRGAPSSIVIDTLILAFLIGIIAGGYPAFVMSRFSPSVALKSNFQKTGDKGLFRKVLVTSQFAVSITLLIVMSFIYRQVNFMLEKDLGFKPDQVVTIPINQNGTHRRIDQLKARFKQIPGVQEITSASSFPGDFFTDWKLVIEGQENNQGPYVLYADPDLGKVLDLDMEMAAGRFFDTNISGDTINNYVVNEALVKKYGLKDPVGQRVRFSWDEEYGQIVGVLKDFHFHDVTREIEPLIMSAGHWRNQVGIKLSANNLPQTIEAIKEVWSEIEPTFPMRYSFLDEDFEGQYANQQRFGKSILYATFLTLFIALLGLFGLTAFTVERRTKEIGVRKVLGASVSNIIGLLTKDFAKLMGFASLIAIPLGYVMANRWLADFAHRTNLAWWIFIGAGMTILIVGLLTVGVQSMRAALVNPVEAIKSE